ncbi:MAG TPA: MFS transporter, partial [Reyranella sp.]|nr:MFS transporter [Reyranella sp.]
MTQAAMEFPASGGTSLERDRIRRRAIISSSVGNFVELYDFLIYGLFAAQIAANFFPKGDPTIALLQAFAIYGVGFFMRPVGAIVIGAYGDRHGRKNALVVTVGLMAGATALTGLIPSYTSFGIAAPLLLLICRLVQGFSTGGEWGGSATFLVEFAPPGKRGLIGSVQQFSVGLALIAGTLTAAVLNGWLSKDDMIAWGWRIPFLIGFVLAPIGLYLRSRVAESPAYSRTVEHKQVAANPFVEALTTHRRPVLAAFGLSAIGTVGNYTYNIFLPAYAGQLKIAAGMAYTSSTIAAVVLTVLTPVMGWLSDKVGRKPILLFS